MLTGERRTVSGRRGMTVLGKIPAVPKPINLPSQRLENRGLDPNVEIVPRGSVSWGAAGRSPPTSTSPWATSTQSSSPPVGGGPWGGAPPRPATANSSGPVTAGGSGSATASSGPWGGNAPRPSSAGSGTRPSSAGSLRQTQEPVAAANAWGPATARPSSASGVLGQAQSQPPVIRPRSAETRTLSTQAPALTRFADQTNGPTASPPPAWGGAGAVRKLSEETHQPARFTLTRVDFPTLGSEKNPDLRPQQNKTGSSPTEHASVNERVPPAEERPPPGPASPYEELPPTPGGAYGGQERIPDSWRRDMRAYGGHQGMPEGNWHRDGHPPMQPYGGGQPQIPDTWRREPGHGAAPGGGPSDDNWRRGGPPIGPYGPPGPGRFQPDPASFMHQQRYGPGPGPGPYGRGGGPGPGAFGRHGEMYGNGAPFGRPGGVAPPRPGPPMGPGMYQGPVPYDYYGPPGPGYGSMDEREMMMLGMNGPPGMYGNFSQGPPVESFGRYPHGGPGPGHRHNSSNSGINRERIDSMGYEGEGYREGAKYKDSSNFKEGGGHDGGVYNNEGGAYKEGARSSGSYQDSGESRRAGNLMGSSLTSEMQRPSSRGGQGGHRDWGAAASSDEPMDFSKPVFEEDVSSGSPGFSNKDAPVRSYADSDNGEKGNESKSVDYLKIQESTEGAELSSDKDKGLAINVEAKDALLAHAPKPNDVNKDDLLHTWKQKELDSGGPISKSRVDDNRGDVAPKSNEVLKEDVVQTWKQKEVAGGVSVPKSRGEDSSAPAKEQLSKKSLHGSGGASLKNRGDEVSGAETKDHVFRKALPSSGGSTPKNRVEDVVAMESKDQVVKKALPSPGGSVSKGGKAEDVSILEAKDQLLKKVLPLSGSSALKRSEDNTAVESKDQPLRKSLPSSGGSLPKNKGGEDISPRETKDQITRKAVSISGSSVPKSRGEDGSAHETKDQLLRKVLPLSGGSVPKSRGEDSGTLELKDQPLRKAALSSEASDSDDTKPRGKILNSHEGEKEWRPKVSAVEVSRSSSTLVPQQAPTPPVSVPSVGAAGGGTAATEKPGPDSGILTDAKNYDYEAQRARMKEIATQRAAQLVKEEEERIKEQKAKALAKLEELNRRSLVVPGNQPEEESSLHEASDEPAILTTQLEESEVVPADLVTEDVQVEDSSGGTGANTPRGSARKGAAATRKRKTKNPGKNSKQKLEGLSISTDSASVVEPNQGWGVDLSSSNDSGTEVGKPASQAMIQSGGDDAVKASPSFDSPKEFVTPDSKPESPPGEHSTALDNAGSDIGSHKANGDVTNKRPQRKTQPTRRVPARDRGTSQDVRVGDKPHGAEGMIWAPVRSPSGAHPAGPKGGFGSDITTAGDHLMEKKDEVAAPPQTGRARRAELERYTPKPVVKQQAQQQEEILQQQATPSVSQPQENESSNAPVLNAMSQNPSSISEIKFGSEARQVDSSSKQGRAHTSWRQRGSGSERVGAAKETHNVRHSESSETGGKSHQPSYNQTPQSYHRNRPQPNAPSELSRPGSSHQVRSDVGQVGRQPPSTVDKDQPNLEVSQQGRTSNSNVPPVASLAHEKEKEQKTPQESVTPYQPPRPGSSQKSRVVESDVQGSNEHVRLHRTNMSHVDRHHGAHGKFDRDHHGSHERGVAHTQSRPHNFRHQGVFVSHERDHQRDVSNAVHHQQQQKGASDGHWQQTGAVTNSHPVSDPGQSYEHSPRSTSHKSQALTTSSSNRDHASTHPGSHQHPRVDPQNKPHAPVASDPQKQPQFQQASHPQKPHPQSVSQGPKQDNVHNSSQWNGERVGSPPAIRGRDHGNSRRGRFGGRSAGGLGRSGEIENRREHPSKQRLVIDATGGPVPSQVGG